jgi:tetratricopeptide (TPR) repeat protein
VEVHNDYLHLLAEYGLIGGLLFAGFLGMHLRNGWKNFRRLGPKRVSLSSSLLSNSLALNVGAIAAVSAYLVHSVLDFNLHIPVNVLLLAFVFGLLANAGVKRETEPSALSAPPISVLRWRLALPAIGVVVLIQVIRLFPAEYFTEHARTSVRDEQADTAAEFAERGLKLDHQNPYLFQYLGAAHLQQSALTHDPQARDSLYVAAAQAFSEARSLAPQDEEFTLALASTYDDLGRFKESEWLYGEALRLDPRSIYTKQAYDSHLAKWQESGALAQSDPIAPHS